MIYTSAQLNKANKDTLISIVEDLQDKVEALSSQPLTGTQVEKAILNLSQKAIEAKTKIATDKQAYDLAVEKLQAETEVKLKELQLDFDSNNGKNVLEINAELKRLEESVEKAKSNLDFGLKQKELEHKEAVDNLTSKYETLKDELEEKYEKLKEYNEIATKKILEDDSLEIEKSNSEVAKIKLENERTLEEMTYEHKIALRDKNLSLASKIAQETGNTIINSKELEIIKAYKEDSEESITNKIETAVKSAESALHSKYNSEKSTLKNDYELKVQLLEKDKQYLSNQVTSLESRIATLQDELSKVPSQIKEAVASARAEINVNQDNKK